MFWGDRLKLFTVTLFTILSVIFVLSYYTLPMLSLEKLSETERNTAIVYLKFSIIASLAGVFILLLEYVGLIKKIIKEYRMLSNEIKNLTSLTETTEAERFTETITEKEMLKEISMSIIGVVKNFSNSIKKLKERNIVLKALSKELSTGISIIALLIKYDTNLFPTKKDILVDINKFLEKSNAEIVLYTEKFKENFPEKIATLKENETVNTLKLLRILNISPKKIGKAIEEEGKIIKTSLRHRVVKRVKEEEEEKSKQVGIEEVKGKPIKIESEGKSETVGMKLKVLFVSEGQILVYLMLMPKRRS